MNEVTTSLWMFKNLTGVMEDWYPKTVCSAEHMNKRGYPDYNLTINKENDTATLTKLGSFGDCKVYPMKYILDILKKENLLKERTTNRHESSRIPLYLNYLTPPPASEELAKRVLGIK